MNHNNKAFTLIELMIAIALAAIFGSVVIGMVLLSQSLADSARLKSNSTAAVDRTIELLRASFRNNYSALGSITNSQYESCFSYDQNNPSVISNSIECDNQVIGNFIGIKYLGVNAVQINAYNNYSDRGKIITNKSSTIISNLK